MTEQEIEQQVLNSKIILSLSVHEVNKLLSIVGKFPFEEVQTLIARIHEEGQPQINKIVADLKAAAEAEETPAAPKVVEKKADEQA